MWTCAKFDVPLCQTLCGLFSPKTGKKEQGEEAKMCGLSTPQKGGKWYRAQPFSFRRWLQFFTVRLTERTGGGRKQTSTRFRSKRIEQTSDVIFRSAQKNAKKLLKYLFQFWIPMLCLLSQTNVTKQYWKGSNHILLGTWNYAAMCQWKKITKTFHDL